jgi:hypothetical protein
MTTQARLAAARLAEVAGGNRRSARRFAYEVTDGPRSVRDEQGRTHSARVVDLSHAGIGLVLDHRPEQGTLLTIELPSKNEAGSAKLVARVSNVRAQKPQGWYAGCLFLRRLDEFELLAVLS